MDEQVNFKITLGTKFSKQPAEIEILFNNNIIVKKQQLIKTKVFEFTLDLVKNKKYNLTINRSNHDEKNEQIVELKKITADDIDLNKLLDHTCFYPKYPTKWFNEQIKLGKTLDAKQQGWRIWGFNGRWEMPFDSPFYDWLLKVI
jgi:hypothetical protein